MTDQEAMQGFLEALNATPKSLRRDVNATWTITGRWGHIIATPEANAFYLVCFTDECDVELKHRTAHRWNKAKQRLAFCQVTQNGDAEGVLRLDRLPNAEEAELLREILGIAKRREYSPEYLATLRERVLSLAGSHSNPQSVRSEG